jgi:hypothetical protein
MHCTSRVLLLQLLLFLEWGPAYAIVHRAQLGSGCEAVSKLVPYRCGCCAASTTTERVRWRKVHQCISIHHRAMAAVGHTSLFAAVQGRLERL